MFLDRKVIIYCRWLLIIAFALIPLLLLPGLFTDLKIEELLRKSSIEMSLTFTYDGERQTKCYTENPEDTQGRSYVFLPSFANIEEVGVEPVSGSVLFQNGEECVKAEAGRHALCSFRPNVVYETHFYNSVGKEIGVQPIVFLQSGEVPTLYVNTRTGKMDKLDADKAYKEEASIELVDMDGNVLCRDDLRSISARGNHTFTFEKKSYQINMTKPADLLGMGISDTWVLLCNVYDPTYVRNKLVYDMALQAKMPGSPKAEYTDVYFNGMYAGLYLLSEKVEIGENRLEIADLERENRALNGEVLDYADTFADEKGKGTKLAANPEDITGGYLIEHDYGGKFQEVVSGFVLDSGEEFALKNPAHASEAEVAYIRQLMQETEDAIAAEDGCNPNTGKHFTEYIDLESWADKYLVEEITRNNGGGTTSSYFYKPSDSVSTKVFGGPVWDYDKSLGREGGYNKNTRDLQLMTLHPFAYTNWFYYLYRHEEFRETVKREYAEKFSDYLTVMGTQKVDACLEKTEKAAVLDRARFAHVYRKLGAVTEDRKADVVRRFIRERKAFLDEVWLEDKPVCFVKFMDENGEGNRSLGVMKGECIQELPDFPKGGYVFQGWKMEGTNEFLSTEMPITENMTVRGVWKAESVEQ